MNVESPSMNCTSNKGFLYRASCTEAFIYTALADMYLSLLVIFSYDFYCKSGRLFVCSCSCCDGKCIVQEIAERIFFFCPPLTPNHQKVSEVCSCCWFVTSWLRRWSRLFRSMSCFVRCGRKRRLDLYTTSAAPCR